MPAEKQQNLQDVFLNHVRKNKVPVTVFLVNGVKLQGVISSFDNFCLLLRRDGQSSWSTSTPFPPSCRPPPSGCTSRRAEERAERLSRHATGDRTPSSGRAWVVCPIRPRRAGRAARSPTAASPRPWAWPRRSTSTSSTAESSPCASRVPATLLGSGKVEEIAPAARPSAPSSSSSTPR